ncbi:MAG: hypothetical protein LBL82_02350 [Oscillospiraceae bacterium]|nr:hypothetical protein [Oscillospiraceae bacterium]
MNEEKFTAILPILVAGLVNKIVEETHIRDDEAIEKLYTSQLYAALEDEATKVWTYSVPKLYELFEQEQSTGELELPEY